MTVYGPLDAAVTKALAGGSTNLFFIGDSTVWGATDDGFSDDNTFVSNGGWPKRLGIAIGQFCNTTVKYRSYVPTTETYTSDATVYTGTGSNVITIINGGVSSQYIATLTNYINTGNLITSDAAAADCVFIGTGINDAYFGATPTTYVPAYITFMSLIRSKCATASICVTTQNVLSSSEMSGSRSQYENNYNALLTDLVSDTLPTNPPLEYSPGFSVWTLDTQQAYGSTYQSSLMSDGVHPNSAGYAAQANWMATKLLDAGPPVIVTPALGSMTVGAAFSQALVASGGVPITWSVHAGTLPAGLSLNATTGTLSGTPTTAGAYSVTIRATNSENSGDHTYTGTVGAPWSANSVGQTLVLLGGTYYPVNAKINISTGQWNKLAFRTSTS